MKKIFIFDFDGTFYSGEHKFDKVKKNIDDNKRKFLSNLTDNQYENICKENPKWNNATTGNDIIRCITRLTKKYKSLNISIDEFYTWQNDFVYDIILDYNKIVDHDFMKQLCKNYPVYVVSNSSLKHIYYYMDKLNIDKDWFKKVIGNEFIKEDPTKEHYYKEIISKENAIPHNVYVLGDSVESDLTPALYLGINAFYVNDASNIKQLVTNILNNEI